MGEKEIIEETVEIIQLDEDEEFSEEAELELSDGYAPPMEG